MILGILFFFSFSCVSSDKQEAYKARMNLEFQSVENLNFSDSSDCIIIDIQKAKFFEEFPIDIEFIRLETPNNELIGTIDRVEFDDGKIFILDQKTSTIHIFHDNGSFLNCIKRIGNGPEEYTTLMDFAIDKKNKLLVLWDAQKKKYLKFNYDGTFISAKHFGFWFREFLITDSGNYILFTNNGNGTGSRVVVADSSGVNVIKKTLPSSQYYKLNYYDSSPILNKYKNKVVCSFPFSNRIFSIDDNSTICRYELVPGNIFYMYNPEIHTNYNVFEKEFLALTNRYFNLGSVLETDDFLVTSLFSSNKKYYHVVYSKITNETRKGHIRIPNSKFGLQSPLNTLNNKFITHLFPYQLLDFKEIIDEYPILYGVREDDNPILVLYSIK
jgi:hypothetical protein